ncbi:MAG: LysR family transcriptional regulator [Clostridia bacterium]|nr:LysR family transcriptional regulator [Clostridia bacterium]
MELNKLYYFHIAAKHQNLTKAAEELYISQPALTKTIKTLEGELEMQLFYKKGKHIYLTDFGRYLKTETDKMFSIWNNVKSEMKKIKNENNNSIRLNVLAATSIVTDAVLEFKKQNKEAIFHIIQNEEVNCDISVTTNSVNFMNLPEFKRKVIFEEKIYLAAPKSAEYENITEISLEEVRDKGFVNLSGSRLFRVVCDKFCESVGFKPNIIFESDSPATVKNIIKTGAGIGFWPEFSWSEFPVNDINLIPIRTPVCQRELIIGLHANAFTSNIVEEFYAFLLDFIRQHTEKK